MLNIILTDHNERDHLLPLTFTRPTGRIRIGIWTIAEKWEKYVDAKVSYRTQSYLAELFPEVVEKDNYYVNGALIPSPEIVDEILNLQAGQSLYSEGHWIASRAEEALTNVEFNDRLQARSAPKVISRNWNIFQWNGFAMEIDTNWLKGHILPFPLPDGVTLIGENLFMEEGAVIRPGVINTLTGPVYIGPHAEVMEGCLIRGGLALLDHAQLKMGSKIYGPTTIGPHSKVGGEVNNAVIFGYSNKGHDGFIGNTVIGEWCNLGADTNTSNLKNNYADVKVHNYALGRSESTGSQFCGLTMGDHAKCSINTMFNTGTVCGIFANVFGAGFPHRRIPDFGWGGADGFKSYRLSDALEMAERVMQRRDVPLTDDWKRMYTHLHNTLSETV